MKYLHFMAVYAYTDGTFSVNHCTCAYGFSMTTFLPEHIGIPCTLEALIPCASEKAADELVTKWREYYRQTGIRLIGE